MSKTKNKSESGLLRQQRRRLTAWEKTALIVAAIFLVQYWMVVITKLHAGEMFAFRNYWGQEIGVLLLAAICFAGTIVWAIAVWRYWIFPLLKSGK